MTDTPPEVREYEEFAHSEKTRGVNITTRLADAAIAELKAALKDRERCGICRHYTLLYARMTPWRCDLGDNPHVCRDYRCRFDPSRWEMVR